MRTALITGASRRIGAGIARALASHGYAVAIHYETSEREARDLVAEIAAAGGKGAAVQGDLSDAADTLSLVEKAAAALSAPTCLVNNASTFFYDTATSLSADQWQRQFDVNLRAPALLSQAFMRGLPADANGVIVHLADQKIDAPTPDFFSYTLTKSAIAVMTRLHAIAFAPRVRVCAVAPGLTLPSGGQSKHRFDAVHDTTILERGNTPADIAEAVCYLVGAEAVTGQVLYVDGGERLGRQHDPQQFVLPPSEAKR